MNAMDLPIVVGVDGSEPSLRAVDWAADEAALRGLPLRLVYASLWERYEGDALAHELGKSSEQVRAEDIVTAAARRAHRRRADVKVLTDSLPEEPEYALVRESRTAALLVTGTRGRGGMAEALLGSVSLTVAGHAHCPMVVVRGGHDNAVRPGGRIVVGVGEGAPVRFAFEEARLRGASVEAVRAWRSPARETTDHPLLAGEPPPAARAGGGAGPGEGPAGSARRCGGAPAGRGGPRTDRAGGRLPRRRPAHSRGPAPSAALRAPTGPCGARGAASLRLPRRGRARARRMTCCGVPGRTPPMTDRPAPSTD